MKKEQILNETKLQQDKKGQQLSEIKRKTRKNKDERENLANLKKKKKKNLTIKKKLHVTGCRAKKRRNSARKSF